MDIKVIKKDLMKKIHLRPIKWKHCLNRFYYDHMRPIFFPQQQRYRKVIPKTFCDVTELILIVNFEFIKGFYEDEYSKDFINWDATPNDKKFKKWIEKAYKYITVDRPKLQEDKDNAYPKLGETSEIFEKFINEDGLVSYRYKPSVDPKKEYDKKYGKVDRLEKLILEKDHKLLKEMIDHRERFWT